MLKLLLKALVTFAISIFAISPCYIYADCCQCGDVSLGWRRDSLHWKVNDLRSCYVHAKADSHILFKDINFYTISGETKWVDSDYYIRFSAEYGLSYKGRAHELFDIKSPWLYYPIGIDTSDKIKRRSEVYDFDLAAGYPFEFFNCRLSVVPLIGFSYHRQRLRVKRTKESIRSQSSALYYCDSYFYFPSVDSHIGFFTSIPESSSFSVDSSNYFRFSPSSNPFSDPSDQNIPSAIGLSTRHRTSAFRFTWYGFYLGADIAYALDTCWTLFSEFEYHFCDRCSRKRRSWTGVYFVDRYHRKSFAYGFDALLGVTYSFTTCWYTTLTVNFKWWKGDSNHDKLYWKTVDARIGLGYTY